MARPKSPLVSPEGRLALLQEFRRRGLYVRMHAYEYLIADEGGFVAILLLEPSEGRATLLDLRGTELTSVLEAISAIDPGLRVQVEQRTSRRGSNGSKPMSEE